MHIISIKKRIRIIASLIALLGLLLSSTISCRGVDLNGYTRFKVREGLASFSFEYPTFFLQPRLDRSHEPAYNHIGSLGTAIPPEQGIEFLSIYVRSPSDSFPDSSMKLDHDLKELSETLNDFKLLERLPIDISGSQGELFAFSYYGLTLLLEQESPKIGTSYIAYFDHGGLIWEVHLTADEDGAKIVETHFEHILETFEINK